MIDICDFAVGLSRQLYGRTIASERPGHRLMETWHPLGVVGVISAFNFPVAVWSWNTAHRPGLRRHRGVEAVGADAADRAGLRGAARPGPRRASARRERSHQVRARRPPTSARRSSTTRGVALVSATGSTRDGPRGRPAGRRPLRPHACSSSAATTPRSSRPRPTSTWPLRGIVFSAAGTAGQRCTTLRRLIVHRERRRRSSSTGSPPPTRRLPIGDPLADGHPGRPADRRRGRRGDARTRSPRPQAEGGEVVAGGERVLGDEAPDAYYVAARDRARCPSRPTWSGRRRSRPILYVLTYDDFDEAIALHNDVPQGLSSSIFTPDQREAERFLAADGSDCGIANVNIGTSGAEIGGAFGGEKETGGGRESGSDAWRAYMRRATNTVNYSGELPLAQGVTFTRLTAASTDSGVTP